MEKRLTHILSWNVNGIRAAVKKGFLDSIREFDPDIICLQETKANEDIVCDVAKELRGVSTACNTAEKKGYSSSAIFYRQQPENISYGLPGKEHHGEGRVIKAEYPDYQLITVYSPNSKRKLLRLDYREKWDKDFLKWLQQLQEQKPVIVCGDFNVAHQPIDIARPKSNYNKTAGYTQREIDGFSRFLEEGGLVDIYRELYPERVQYSWWSYMFGARKKNIGWRLDYFLLSRSLLDQVVDSSIHDQVLGSDHCPISLKIKI